MAGSVSVTKTTGSGGLGMFSRTNPHQYCASTACPHRESIKESSEDALVAVFNSLNIQLLTCSACNSKWYCSRTCQKFDWKNGHKIACGKIVKLQEARPNTTKLNPFQTATAMKAYDPCSSVEVDKRKPVSSKRSFKVMAKLTAAQKSTLEILMIVCSVQSLMSDKFDRIAKGLPPREEDFLFHTQIDVIKNANSEELVKIWNVHAGHFKSWIFRSSTAGLDFENQLPQALTMIPEAQVALELLEGWEPIGPTWLYDEESLIISVLVAGLCHQKYYLDRILPQNSPLHRCIAILIRWVQWDGPTDHPWNHFMEMIFAALLSGVELTQKVYHVTVDVSLLQPLIPVAEKLVHLVASDSSRFKAFDYSNVDITLDIDLTQIDRINRLKMFYADRGTRELSACLRAKRLFPDLKIKPLRKLARFIWKHTSDLLYFEQEHQLLKNIIELIANE